MVYDVAVASGDARDDRSTGHVGDRRGGRASPGRPELLAGDDPIVEGRRDAAGGLTRLVPLAGDQHDVAGARVPRWRRGSHAAGRARR